MKNVFSLTDSSEVINRIGQLTPDTKGLWGKMSVAQMLAHCNVTYEMAYENIHPAPNAFVKFILKLLVKKSVVNETPYKKSIQTAPAFIINSNKDFAIEKERLVNYIKKTQELGASYFEGKESLSFGSLNKTEWNNMFYKHLDHHLQQFAV
ncbi:MAG: DUF1569 domain-containing protein [Bacteroidota bacterium]